MISVTTISTDFLFTGEGKPLQDAFIRYDKQGIIKDYGICKRKNDSIRHYPGAICPGFIDAHIHTELSHIGVLRETAAGMAGFIGGLARVREKTTKEARENSIISTINFLYNQGVSGAGDICNEPVSFSLKHNNQIKWHHFIECFGTDTASADEIASKADQLHISSEKMGFQSSITPHATYSLSNALIRTLNKKLINTNDLLSYHFMESREEIELLTYRTGALADLFKHWGILPDFLTGGIKSPLDQLLVSLPKYNRLLLVHNTFIDNITVKIIMETFSDPWFCLCPVSNLTISGELPPVNLLRSNTDKIVIGTDSNASNEHLSMIEEIRTIQKAYPQIPIHELITWATSNGATFFGWDQLGTITSGKSPGLVWLNGFINPDEPLSQATKTTRII
ncbi:MAG: hypothetical protein CVU06_11605 [Bacteroidetes bacterium HGW-Bacteroidetes-22]|nr:MAG: hypothetical protein CVU06_11605 [Bacteroidetes bacterium HGW-Bacteroidetes-22]